MQSDSSEINDLLQAARTASDNGNFEAALRDAQAALLLSEKLGLKNSDVYKLLAELYERQERWEEAQSAFKNYYRLEKEIHSDESRRQIESMNIRIATAEKEKEVNEQRIKAEQLEKEMRRQREELSNKALQLVRQTDMLQSFRSNLEGIVLKAETAEKAIKEVRKSLKQLPENMQNWELFTEEFKKVHADFDSRLRKEHPSLSTSEVRVCCLLLIGMKTNEIATMLFVSERTVDIHRGHIRKKLNLVNTDIIKSRLEEI